MIPVKHVIAAINNASDAPKPEPEKTEAQLLRDAPKTPASKHMVAKRNTLHLQRNGWRKV